MGLLEFVLLGETNKKPKNLTEKSKCPKCTRNHETGRLFKREEYGKQLFWCVTCGTYWNPDGTEYILHYSNMYICPRCGKIKSFVNDEPRICPNCGFIRTIETDCTAQEWNSIVTQNPDGWMEIQKHLRERYVLDNDQFDKNRYNTLVEKEYKKFLSWKRLIEKDSASSPSTPQPHCPTCGSTNVKRISAASKVAGAYAFGLFSKTVRSQFKCGNCGYKW